MRCSLGEARNWLPGTAALVVWGFPRMLTIRQRHTRKPFVYITEKEVRHEQVLAARRCVRALRRRSG